MLNDHPATSGITPEQMAETLSGLLSGTQAGDQDTDETPDADQDETADDVTEEDAEADNADDAPADEESTEEPESLPEDETEETATDDEGTRKHKVRVDGEEIEVSYDELLAGFSRTKDYTRKTQAVAERAKKLEAVEAEYATRRTQMDEGLKQIEETLQAMTPQEPDWDRVRMDNPTEYPLLLADWQRYQGKLAAVKAARKQIADEAAREGQTKSDELARQEFEKLVAAVPSWKDKKVRVTELTKLAETARAYGFTEDEINSIADHRTGLLLRDAMLYREALSQRKAAQAKLDKAKNGKRAAPPGSVRATVPTPISKRAKVAADKLAKSGSVSDAAAAILPYLQGGKK